MTDGRSLAEPAFPDDDGTVDAALAAAFGDDTQVLEVLGGVRVFVPVIALVGDTPADSDKEADMAAVLMTGADGRTALLAFSSVATMTAWNGDARPVPVWGRDAARAALDEQATAVLLDLGSPTFTVVETADVGHLAAGHRLVSTDAGPAWLA
ncbi:SseB family protein [Aeromicrobium sp.]|uniref:SseB family protein n=1 Tax=Aeromicrobium sp. TaxID=1871063 RepID=UPI003C3FEBD9